MCACNSVTVFTIDGHKFMIFLRNSYPHTHIFRFIAKKYSLWLHTLPKMPIRNLETPRMTLSCYAFGDMNNRK